jgi:hypothetical protein
VKDTQGRTILSKKQYERFETLTQIPLILLFILFIASLITLCIAEIVNMEKTISAIIACIAIGNFLIMLSTKCLAFMDKIMEKYVIEEENPYAYLQQLGYEGEELKAAQDFLTGKKGD